MVSLTIRSMARSSRRRAARMTASPDGVSHKVQVVDRVVRDPREIRTDRLLLRFWRDSDREPFAAMNADSRVMEHLPAVLSREESDSLADRLEASFVRERLGLWALELPGVAPFIGYVGLAVARFEAPFTPCVEVGWRLARPFWGSGYATEAARESVRDGFERLVLNEIVAFTVPSNERSIRVMERLGMQRSPQDDFEHPGLAPGHRLSHHVLYRLDRPTWLRLRDSEAPSRSRL